MRWLALVMLVACSYATTSTRRVAVLGYSKRPRIVIATTGETWLAKPWIDLLRAANTAEIVRTEELTAVDTDATLCERSRDVDEILTLSTTIKQETHSHCTKNHCSTPDIIGEGTSGEAQCGCVESKYDGTTGQATMHWRVLRASTCEILRAVVIETPAREVATTADADKDMIGRLAGDLMMKEAVEGVPGLFPSGNALLGINGRTLEVGNDDHPFVAGNHYWLRDQMLGSGPRLTATRADDRTATLEADLAPSGVDPGDEIHETTHIRRQTVYGALSGGRGTSGEGAYGQAGASVAVRMSFDRIPLMGEINLSGDILPRFGVSRFSGGLAGGVRFPLGPVNPVGFGEAGLSKLYQENATANGAYLGLGGGIEVWFSGLFIFADARLHKYWLQDWKDGDGNEVSVKYSDLDSTTVTIELAVGRVY